MSSSFWARNIYPGEAVHLAPSQTLIITNVALSREGSDLGRTSLTFCYMLSNAKASPPVTICTLMLGRTDQLSTDIRFLKGGKYILQVEGPNPMSVVGFHDSAASNQTLTSAVPFRPSLGVSSGTEPHVANRGTRAEADGLRAETLATQAQAAGLPQPRPAGLQAQPRPAGLQAQPRPVLQTQPRPVDSQTQPRPVGLQTQPVGLMQTDGIRAEQTGIEDEAVVEAVGTRLQAVGRQTHTDGARAEAVQRSSFPTPHNQYAPFQTNDASEFTALRSGNSKSTPLPSKGVPKPSMAANLAAFQSIGTPAPFPFAPVLGTNSNVARHNAAGDEPGSSIYDSMHAPKTTAPQPVHSTKPSFRFGGPFMPLAEVPSEASNSDSAFRNPGILDAAGGASCYTGTGDVGRLTPMRLNKGKDKASVNQETDAEDL
ncbi:hypothetical protein EV360DRAFT_81828 [Lentinula raphanica]|nr:hypothetical protein EV360DRAFT_81828 [Lentinula raphanica]